jgi:hypothetical protein
MQILILALNKFTCTKINKSITRKDFINKSGVIAAASVLSPIILCGTARASQGKKIRIGIIGCGSVSGVYLPHLSECQYAEVVSVCDIIF